MPEPQIALKVALLGPAVGKDAFGRAVSSTWGNADTGGAWNRIGGVASDLAVASGTGRHSHSSINVLRGTTLTGSPLLDLEQLADAYPAVAPAGAAVVTGMLARYAAGNFYWLRTEWTSGGTVMLKLVRFSGSFVELGVLDPVPGVTPTAGVPLRTRTQVVGDRLRIKVWPAAGAEPAGWHLDITDPAPLTAAGDHGVQSWVVSGNSNPLPVVVHFDNYQATPYWTDLAGRLLYGDGGGPLTIDVGRQTELQDVEPTRIAATLKNGDGWLNPRNPSSPYYGTWEQGRQVRVTETVGGEEIDLATGYLEIPDVQVNSPNLDQPCSISAVDILGRLAGAAPFTSTLGEHVRSAGGALREWWPLTEPSWPFQSAITDAVGSVIVGGFREVVAREPADLLRPNGQQGPPGDDLSYALWEPMLNAAGDQTLAWASVSAPLAVSVGAADTIALSVWVNATTQVVAPGSIRPETTFLTIQTPGVGGLALLDETSGITGFVTGAPDVVGSRELERDVWRLITLRANFATGAVDLWVGSDLAASVTGSLPAGITLTNMLISTNFAGALGHIQIRVGAAAATMTREMHLAQYAHGYRGLHRQTVAERSATLASYAGLTASDLDLPAEAATPLQRAQLAGGNPAAAMQDAATAGQDILMTTPQGRITLVPRGRRYNQPVTMSIPFGWLSRGGIRYRPDKPVTDIVATLAGGGSARRVSDQLRARYGVLARTVTLDSDIDADPANWASWTLAAMGEPRTRCPLIRLDMLHRTATERKALLRLRVGDRIQLTGMPVNSPEDVPHLIVQGIRHIIGPHRRRLIEMNTSPLLGPSPGVAPACPVVGDLVSNTAIVAY